MSYVESPAETVRKFAASPGWKSASVDEIAADFFSISNETNLNWDQYIYEDRDGRLYDPKRKRIIAGTGNGDAIEEGINIQLEQWFYGHDSGIAVWISPRGGGLRPYPDEKIAIHRIAYEPSGKKVLLSASHQFKTNFRNPEELRMFLFTEEDKEESVIEIINWLVNISEKEVETQVDKDSLQRRRAQAEYFAIQYKSGASVDEMIYEMRRKQFLGENSISCGGGGGLVSFLCQKAGLGNFEGAGKFVRSCGKCGAPINSTISAGFTCPGCGGGYLGC